MEALDKFGARNEMIVPIQNEQHMIKLPLLPVGTVFPVAIVFQVTTVVHVILRFISRRRTRLGLGGDDWTLLAAAVFANVLCILCCWEAAIAERDPEAIFVFNIVLPAPSVLTAAINTFCCITTLLFTKASILFLYRRIFPQSWLRMVTYALFVCISIWWVMFLVISTVLSDQLQDAYSSVSVGSHAIKHLSIATEALVVLDVICKFCLLIIPIPIVVRLQMSRSRKIQTIFLFVVGSICVVSSAIRFTCVFKLMSSLSLGQNDVQEFTTLVKNSYIWTIVDACLGVNEACLPMVKQLVEIWTGREAQSSDQGSFSHLESTSSTAFSSSHEHNEKTKPVIRDIEIFD